jgi:preprotein translocase SecE subunit
LNRETEVAKNFGKVTVSDDVIEPDEETVEEASEVPSDAPPAKATTSTRSSSGGGGDRRPKKASAQPGLFARIGQFLHDTRAEMRRVSWPSATLVKNSTLITLVAVIFFALYLFAVDRVWAFLIERLRTALGG